MRVVYNTTTKELEQVSISSVTEPKCSQICKYHTEEHTLPDCPECENCFATADNHDALNNMKNYYVDDSVSPKQLKQKDVCRILMSCNKQLVEEGPPSIYNMNIADNSCDVTVQFKDGEGNSITPTGELVLTPGRGSLEQRIFNLNGSASSVQTTWTTIQETINVGFKAELSDHIDPDEKTKMIIRLYNT